MNLGICRRFSSKNRCQKASKRLINTIKRSGFTVPAKLGQTELIHYEIVLKEDAQPTKGHLLYTGTRDILLDLNDAYFQIPLKDPSYPQDSSRSFEEGQTNKVTYLGYLLTERGVSIDRSSIEPIVDYVLPKSVKDI